MRFSAVETSVAHGFGGVKAGEFSASHHGPGVFSIRERLRRGRRRRRIGWVFCLQFKHVAGGNDGSHFEILSFFGLGCLPRAF